MAQTSPELFAAESETRAEKMNDKMQNQHSISTSSSQKQKRLPLLYYLRPLRCQQRTLRRSETQRIMLADTLVRDDTDEEIELQSTESAKASETTPPGPRQSNR